MEKKKKECNGPAEKKAVQKVIQAAVLTDNLLIGVLAAKNDKDYDLKKNRLK